MIIKKIIRPIKKTKKDKIKTVNSVLENKTGNVLEDKINNNNNTIVKDEVFINESFIENNESIGETITKENSFQDISQNEIRTDLFIYKNDHKRKFKERKSELRNLSKPLIKTGKYMFENTSQDLQKAYGEIDAKKFVGEDSKDIVDIKNNKKIESKNILKQLKSNKTDKLIKEIGDLAFIKKEFEARSNNNGRRF